MQDTVILRETHLTVEGRRVSAQELADLSDEWENPTVDIRKYYQCVVISWEVTKEEYQEWKRQGGLCQVHEERFYIA